MATPFMSEIKMFSFKWPPESWALCDGQLLPISQNTALFSLLGTGYGGDGRVNFGLPDLRGRTPVHMGHLYNHNYARGQHGGVERVTLTLPDLAAHSHLVSAAVDNGEFNPSYEGSFFSQCIDGKTGQPAPVYRGATNLASFNPETVSTVGGNQSHENLQPFLVTSFCIALQGAFPSRN